MAKESFCGEDDSSYFSDKEFEEISDQLKRSHESSVGEEFQFEVAEDSKNKSYDWVTQSKNKNFDKEDFINKLKA